jgi:acetolactate synthase-1/2/3 large subunit
MAATKDQSATGFGRLERVTVDEAAEGYVAALTSQGVDCLFLNPGTDTFPIQEALAKFREQGRPAPRTILCVFELVALAAAHGYYAATGRPQAVLVHVDVGTQNLGSMLHNAQRGRAAVFIGAGRAPYTVDPAERGSRDTYIHWLQEQLDQHGVVRNFVKWDYELRRPDQVGEVIARAFQIAASDPPGPVYLTLPREVLMDDVGEVAIYPPARMPPARVGAGDPDALQNVAWRLVESKRPVVLTSTTGRTIAGFRGLLRLAELLALPVVEWRGRANFPSEHPLYQGHDVAPWLASADLVLILDHDVPYIPTHTGPAADATVIQVDLDPVKERIPLWTFPVDIAIRADTGRALDLIASSAELLLTDARRDAIDARRQELAARHERMRHAWQEEVARAKEIRPIRPSWLANCLGQLYEESGDWIVVDEGVTNDSFIWNGLPIREPGSWFTSGGSGLGWGLGAALGVKLARPDRTVVALVGDGSFVFGEPLAALWAAQTNAAPILVVIFNNVGYNATRTPLAASYPEGYSVKTERFVGVDLLPAPRYDLLAATVGAHGERVADPAEVLPALRRALTRVRAGQSAIVDVLVGRP